MLLRSLAFVAVAAASVAAFVACSSSDSGQPAQCPIVGSYAVSNLPVSLSCPETDGGGTVDITPNGDSRFHVGFHGLSGDCPLEKTDLCKGYGACDLTARDDAGVTIATGKVQYSWEFNDTGFSGSTYFQGSGCTQSSANLAKRH